MKHIQGSSLTGYVTVFVKGIQPELFFQRCSEQDIIVWNVEKKSENVCSGNVKLQDISRVKHIKRGTDYKLSFKNKRGFPFMMKKFTRKKEILVGLLLSILLIFFLSNIIWEIKITGVPKDIEEKISEQLTQYGVHQGTWSFTLDSPSEIQQNLINDIPELLWVGVQQKGTSFLLEGVEKTIVEEDEVEGPRNLVATKKGVIENMYVSKGLPQVQVNDYVEPGDVLVSGKIQFTNDEQTDDDGEEEDEAYELIAAEGEVIARTWYETEVTVPLKTNYEQLTGDSETKYHLKMLGAEFPVWGFGNPEYKDIHRERHEKDLYFFKWKLPITFMETILSEKTYHEAERSKEEAIDVGIKQAKNELQLRLGPEAEIISENILQETTENGKVKLILYMAVEENIVKYEPIDQGD
ncbi:similar to stage IV sporulation protein [Lentibacillus halodurans]|uniref:Similar to stage IV sporulation protein n=1 Tax=Lentibacillus halodurans TaxID=237679 RepID=A0A1I0V201_9BACI|nr:sporulation protein YqfD [Lentibacillus halodurans]SFA70348.1 similar to stage IV sporulation protein [Lentibacillus halodurans]